MGDADIRIEKDSLGEVAVPASKLWGAQTQRSLEHFSIGTDLIPREMIAAYAILKKGAANANHAGGRLDDQRHALIALDLRRGEGIVDGLAVGGRHRLQSTFLAGLYDFNGHLLGESP